LQNNGGYVAGNNSYKDKAKADFFNNYQPYTQVTGAILGFAKANAAGPNSTVTVAVWNNSGTGGKPGTIIGSQTVSIGTIVNNITAQQPTVVTFATPINIPGNFYLGVVLSNTAGDTVALITNTN
jgi:hypothetical protein